jgi:mRNA-degrading endonuclease RelE of RelBE toxin-antitoxin system
MPFQVTLTPRAEADLDYFKRFEQRTIVDTIRRLLSNEDKIEL